MIHKVFLLRKVVRQQGVTALLLYQAQTVAFRPQRLRISKKTVRSLFFNFTVNVLRRQMAVYFVGYVTALPKAGQKVLETTTQSALRRMWIVNVRNSLYCRSGQRTSCFVPGSTPGILILPMRRYSPIHFLKHPVEIRGVLLYDKKRRFFMKREAIMTEEMKIGLTCLITFCIMLVIVINIYLAVGRKIEPGFKEVLGTALKFALSTSITIITCGSTVENWFLKGETYLGMYVYFLTFLVALISARDTYKTYVQKQNIYKGKCQGKRIVICPKCGREIKVAEKSGDNVSTQKIWNDMDIYICKRCGYAEFFKKNNM